MEMRADRQQAAAYLGLHQGWFRRCTHGPNRSGGGTATPQARSF